MVASNLLLYSYIIISVLIQYDFNSLTTYNISLNYPIVHYFLLGICHNLLIFKFFIRLCRCSLFLNHYLVTLNSIFNLFYLNTLTIFLFKLYKIPSWCFFTGYCINLFDILVVLHIIENLTVVIMELLDLFIIRVEPKDLFYQMEVIIILTFILNLIVFKLIHFLIQVLILVH